MLIAIRYPVKISRNHSFIQHIPFGQKLHNKAQKAHNNSYYEECYKLLDVKEGCNQAELRESFLKLARKYHPDSDSSFSDAAKFTEIEIAYRVLRDKLINEGQQCSEEPEKDFGIKHTAPQHRQYLEYDGIGSGTPSQRLRQYQNYRVARAADNVLEHRMEVTAWQNENTLVVKDKQTARKHKIRNALDRLVEDLIQESMNKGEFDNLPGQGKPLNYSNYNPYIDSTTHKLNEVLINNGFTPSWILLQKDIQEDKKRFRQLLQEARNFYGPFPLSETEQLNWKAAYNKLSLHVANINEKINKYNLLVPFLYKQLAPIQLEREADNVLKVPPSKIKKNVINSELKRDLKNKTAEKEYKGFFIFLDIFFTNKKSS